MEERSLLTNGNADRNPWVYGQFTATDRIAGRAMVVASRLGISVFGSRLLRVRGRRSGVDREVPVNPLPYRGRTYLVAPRGHVQWTRNLRTAGQGELLLGRRHQRFTSRELTDQEKPELLRAYLRKWGFEVDRFFGGVHADAPDADLARILPDHPIFEITLDG